MQSARGFEYGVRHILSPQSGLISDVLLGTIALTPKELEFLFDIGGIYLNEKRITKDCLIPEGAYLRVHTKPRRFPKPNCQLQKLIVFSNEEFVVINKPSGLPVHASVDNLKENLQFYLEQELNCQLYVTHRLDVPTSGLILFAKSVFFQKTFNDLLTQRKVKKNYRARVEGQNLKVGLLKHYMEPSPRAPKKVSLMEQPGWQECLLSINSISLIGDEFSELKIELLTGRTHQIRAQLSAELHPIVGDVSYGARKIFSEEKIELEACGLEFLHPNENKIYSFKTGPSSC